MFVSFGCVLLDVGGCFLFVGLCLVVGTLLFVVWRFGVFVFGVCCLVVWPSCELVFLVLRVSFLVFGVW